MVQGTLIVCALCAAVLAACASPPHPLAEGLSVQRVDTIYVNSDSVTGLPKVSPEAVDSLRRYGVVRMAKLMEPPEILHLGRVEYPNDLRERGIQGRIVLRCIVGRHGRVEESTIEVVSTDDFGFVFPAKQALRTALFVPAKVAGHPVRVLVNVPIDFKIRRGAVRP